MSTRRTFVAQMGAVAAASLIDSDELKAGAAAARVSKWDTSWIDRLTSAQFRVVFNASEIAEGAVLSFAATFLDHCHEVHGTDDAQARPVAVFRRMGTPMAFNDSIWERYSVGKERKINDSATKAPAVRNIYWSAAPGASAESAAMTLESLHKRGMISLVCNIATEGFGHSLAQANNKDAAEVIRDLKNNMIPGAILVPSGIYALIRAQNAGCAYMPGT